MVAAVINKILPQIEEWQQRPLSEQYAQIPNISVV